jgi:tripartite-type tricarboxylate transporter receptor subunit TctC
LFVLCCRIGALGRVPKNYDHEFRHRFDQTRLAEALKSADTKNVSTTKTPPRRNGSAEFGKFIEDEIAKWGPVVQKAGMKAE